MCAAYTLDTTLPMTATPSAPPTWRVVSLTAEPTPAFSRGSEPITDSVAGAIVMPMPDGHQAEQADHEQVRRVAWMNDSDSSAAAMISRPAVTTRFVPTRSTTRADSGATTIIVRAYGIIRTPAPRGL